MDLYSASAEDMETVCCFLVVQEIGEVPRRTIDALRERRVSGQAAQSESQ